MQAETECQKQVTNSGFNQKIIDFIDKIEYRRLETPEELEEVFRLRYRAFRRENFIEAKTDQRCPDPLDFTENSYILGLFLEDKLVSSIRLHVLDENHRECPSMMIYSDKLEPLLDSGKTIIDLSRFCTDFETSKKHRALPFATIRLASMAALYFKADHGLTMVREEHAVFYKKIYQSRQIGEARSSRPYANYDISLYCTDIERIRNQVLKRYPFFMASADENELLFNKESCLATA